MSRVLMNIPAFKDTFQLSSGTVTTGWTAGQVMTLNSIGQAILSTGGDNVVFVSCDQQPDTSSLFEKIATPPTGSLVTGIYGCGTTLYVDHSDEVAASDATRAYNATCESGTLGANLYVDSSGKFTTTTTGSVKAKLVQVPTANNKYTIGVILRF